MEVIWLGLVVPCLLSMARLFERGHQQPPPSPENQEKYSIVEVPNSNSNSTSWSNGSFLVASRRGGLGRFPAGTCQSLDLYLKVHQREKFFGSDFEFFTIL
jgi:hypothetical protein